MQKFKKYTLISSLPDFDSRGSGEGAKDTDVNVLVFFYQAWLGEELPLCFLTAVVLLRSNINT